MRAGDTTVLKKNDVKSGQKGSLKYAAEIPVLFLHGVRSSVVSASVLTAH
jgi:hypothetical protein